MQSAGVDKGEKRIHEASQGRSATARGGVAKFFDSAESCRTSHLGATKIFVADVHPRTPARGETGGGEVVESP